MTKSYSELLRDPRWQKRRLEIMSLDYFQCRQCNSKENILNVHHLWYEKGKSPWEYPDECLITLCEKCHERMPSVNWKKAFLELNMTEEQLLDLAFYLKHLIRTYWKNIDQDFKNKYKTRCFPDHYTINLVNFDSEEELKEFFNHKSEKFKDYIDPKYLSNG